MIIITNKIPNFWTEIEDFVFSISSVFVLIISVLHFNLFVPINGKPNESMFRVVNSVHIQTILKDFSPSDNKITTN